jgi:flagellar assembly protein FliH
MGEIYRSVSVTGTRTLLAERAERIAKTGKERKQSGQGGTVPAVETDDGTRRPDEMGATAEVTVAPRGTVNEQLLQEDLLAIQQKHLEQVEQEKLSLEEQLIKLEQELHDAKEKLDKLQAAEESAGYKEGYEKAALEAQKENEGKLAELRQAMALFGETLHAQVKQVDKYAVELAFAALARIVGEQHTNAVFTKAVVQEALLAVRGSSKVVVRVSQSDFDVLKNIQGDLVSAGQFSELQLIADPRVSVGGCLIETENGTWDARLETQLLRLKDTVEQSLKKSE